MAATVTDINLFYKRLFNNIGSGQELINSIDTINLEYLATFYGFSIAVCEWSPIVDLKNYGFKEGSTYTILDRDFNKIYTKHSETGLFGLHEEDKDILKRKKHGSLLHVLFTGSSASICGLFIVVNKNPTQKNIEIASETLAKTERLLTRSNVNELFVNLSGFNKGVVKLYHIPTPKPVNYSIEQIKSNPTREDYILDVGRVNVVYPSSNGWYLFENEYELETESGELTINRDLLRLEVESGLGEKRLIRGVVGAYFIAVNNQTVSGTIPRAGDLLTNNSAVAWYEKEERLHLFVNAVPSHT
jgi:hypothetical protein